MKFLQRWWGIVALLLVFATTVSFLAAQTEEPSAVNTPSRAEVQSGSNEPRQNQPVPAPNRDIISAEAERHSDELRHEFPDDRVKMINRWLTATAIFLTLLGITAAILGYFGFKRLARIESEARKNMEASEKYAKEAQRYKEEAQRDLEKIRDEARRYIEETRSSRDEADSLVKGINAEVAGTDTDKTSEIVKNIQQNPDSSIVEHEIAAALSLQRQNKIEEAIDKWNFIANAVEETNNDLAARAWFFIGCLVSPKNVDSADFERAVESYDKAIKLNPDYAEAYYSRGNANISLGQTEAGYRRL